MSLFKEILPFFNKFKEISVKVNNKVINEYDKYLDYQVNCFSIQTGTPLITREECLEDSKQSYFEKLKNGGEFLTIELKK